MRPNPAPNRPGLARIDARAWPWAVLAVALVPAVWHVVVFPNGADGEFPGVTRPTFSAYPPAAYRLAEPGDTLDRIAVYLASAAVAVAGYGALRRKAAGTVGPLWIAALGLALGLFWYAANPWPTFDGWHGLGWRVVFDPAAPTALRVGLATAALVVAAMAVIPVVRVGGMAPVLIARARRRGDLMLMFLAATALIGLRVAGLPAVEPRGYWTRWAMIGGTWLFLAAMIRCAPRGSSRRAARVAWGSAIAGVTVGLIAAGLTVVWYHRPLDRLRAIDPGRVFISAMPHGPGLEIAHRRHGFKTIINLFQEELPGLRSPHLDDEIAFAEEHGIHYIRSPMGAAQAGDYLDETLRLAADPDAWPILVHCHGCMDRAPAWWGIYRFLIKGEPLVESLRGIEQHRGSRPKASVTLLYNRVLAERAPDRYRDDPTADLLRQNARGTVDPFHAQLAEELRLARDEARPDAPVRD